VLKPFGGLKKVFGGVNNAVKKVGGGAFGAVNKAVKGTGGAVTGAVKGTGGAVGSIFGQNKKKPNPVAGQAMRRRPGM